jgi:alkylation response protein AidB-like acyl-CoA dehydrogenase
MNVLGATGLAVETGIERLYRDIRMLAIPDGTNEILALIHGRELTGIEALRGTAGRPG